MAKTKKLRQIKSYGNPGKHFGVRLPVPLHKRLHKEAKRLNMSASRYVAEAIEERLTKS